MPVEEMVTPFSVSSGTPDAELLEAVPPGKQIAIRIRTGAQVTSDLGFQDADGRIFGLSEQSASIWGRQLAFGSLVRAGKKCLFLLAEIFVREPFSTGLLKFLMIDQQDGDGQHVFRCIERALAQTRLEL